MTKRPSVLFFAGLAALALISGCLGKKDEKPIGMAVEFTDHAACSFIAQDKGWYGEEGLELSAYESYVTGMALASALVRGDIQVAYVCLIPAINAYANTGVPIKVVAGTHKYGYSLVVDPDKVKGVNDLERPGIRIGCVREGGAVDVLLHRFVEKYQLDKKSILANLQRMNPPMQVMATRTGRLDAAFMPEHHASVAEEYGFRMLIQSRDIWPELQGSVLVVKSDLIDSNPEMVRKLVKVTRRATDWARQNKDEAASIVAGELQAAKGKIFPARVTGVLAEESITSGVMYRSMWKDDRLKFTTGIDPGMVQDMIDYLAGLGYIKESFPADEILDLRFLEQ